MARSLPPELGLQVPQRPTWLPLGSFGPGRSRRRRPPGGGGGRRLIFTVCTVLPVAADARCCASSGLATVPHAYPKLWKHHAAQLQADRLTDLAHERGEARGDRPSSAGSFLGMGGQGLQLLEEDPEPNGLMRTGSRPRTGSLAAAAKRDVLNVCICW